MKKTFEKFIRLRFAVPFLIATALVLALVGEWTYQRTVGTLRYGIALTEARIGGAHILQLLTDAESAERRYLLSAVASDLEPMYRAEQELRGNQKVLDFIASIGPAGPEDARHIQDLVTQRLDDLGRSTLLAKAGDRAGALAIVNSREGRQRTDELRARFNDKFSEAATMQQGARSVIYDALLFNRIAVLLLSLLIAMGMYWYWKRLHQLDRERHSRQQVLEAEVTHKTAELRTLAGYMQTVREDEKSHLARELHDELGGLLTAAKLTLARMRVKLSPDAEMVERIEQINGHLNGGIALKRKIVEDLRPSTLSTLGLNIALDIICSDTSKYLGFAIQTNIADIQLPPDVELGLFRIVQEALTNIGKYAAATQVSVELQQTDTEILLDIKDNGNGFDIATLKPGQHGLAGMRFRVESMSGKMLLKSIPGEGVHIAVRVPKPAPAMSGGTDTGSA